MPVVKISMIVACGEAGEIGRDGKLPWPRLRKDMQWFVQKTFGKALIMGRATYESLPFKPLAGRRIVILTRDAERGYGLIRQLDRGQRHMVDVATTLDHAVHVARLAGPLSDAIPEGVVICGGGEVYREALDRDLAGTIYLTKVGGRFEADAHFPYPLPADVWAEKACQDRWFTDSAAGLTMGFYEYTRKQPLLPLA